jgi:hypothetical protein
VYIDRAQKAGVDVLAAVERIGSHGERILRYALTVKSAPGGIFTRGRDRL